MSFELSNVFDIAARNPAERRYLNDYSNDAMDAYMTRVNPNYIPSGRSYLKETAQDLWDTSRMVREGRLATSAEIAKAAQEYKVAQAYAASAKPARYNPNDIYSLVDRNTGRIIPLSDAQAGGITPAQYLVASELLKRRGYRGF